MRNYEDESLGVQSPRRVSLDDISTKQYNIYDDKAFPANWR
jgi:hypothetical protein